MICPIKYRITFCFIFLLFQQACKHKYHKNLHLLYFFADISQCTQVLTVRFLLCNKAGKGCLYINQKNPCIDFNS